MYMCTCVCVCVEGLFCVGLRVAENVRSQVFECWLWLSCSSGVHEDILSLSPNVLISFLGMSWIR